MSVFTRVIEPRKALPVERQIFSSGALKAMILPLFIEQLLQMIVGIADTMMVSYAGEATVSGVSLDTMIYTIFIYMFTAVSAGGAVVVSQYLGSKDGENADRSAASVYRLALFVSLICMAIILIFGRFILGFLYPGVENEVMQACRTYLWIVAISFPANAVYNAGAALYRSMGKTRSTMYVSMAMNLLNVAGNAIGIFVLHAGAAGVAWPTTISWYFAAIVMTAMCMKKEHEVTFHPALSLKANKDMSKRIMGVAVPNAVEGTLFQLAKVVLGSLIATFGTVQIAANGIGQTIWSLAACMGTSLGPVYITVIGRCMGADDKEAANWYMHKLTRMAFVLAIVWNALILAVTPLILPLYSVSAETKQFIWIIVIIHNVFAAFIQPFSGPLSNGLRAAGDVKFTMWASLFATVVCRTMLSFILGLWLNMGVIGIALAMGLDWCIKATLDLVRWKSGKWMEHKII